MKQEDLYSPQGRSWTTRRDRKTKKIETVNSMVDGKVIPTHRITQFLEGIIESGSRIALEGNNQKQAAFLSQALSQLDPEKVNHLHMIISSVSLPEHLDLFEKKIAEKLDFSYSGAQSVRMAQLIEKGIVKLGSIHTYLEIYGRLFIDLTPDIALVAADKADVHGNLYTGPNTEETPTIVEATAFRNGIVIVQVNEIVEELPRVDIPGSWVDYIVVADKPYQLEPLFTKDPSHISDRQILMAMMTIRGIYERHKVTSLNHGIGYNTAAIELLLPTYGQKLGLKGKICRNWALNPHPTLIPAIESGWVESVHCFGGEVGMEKYVAARPDIFFTGKDGSLRSNRTMSQVAGQYAIDLFIGATLQMDTDANSSTVTLGRLTGFGGAPNMGSDARGRRHATESWMDMSHDNHGISRGKKLVVQMVETMQKGNKSTFVDTLDAIAVGKSAKLPMAPVMIYGDDITHVVTEVGIAYLYKAQNIEERRMALSAIAGETPFGKRCTQEDAIKLRSNGMIVIPEDLNIRCEDANRSLLAAKNMEELVQWSQGLYELPAKFRMH